jgi:uncharacterized protein YjiS (DUF1127 family)
MYRLTSFWVKTKCDQSRDWTETSGNVAMEIEMYGYNSQRSGISIRRARQATVLGGVARAFDALASWQDRRRQRQALARLDDRMLRDIGLTISDVEAELAKPFWR